MSVELKIMAMGHHDSTKGWEIVIVPCELHIVKLKLCS